MESRSSTDSLNTYGAVIKEDSDFRHVQIMRFLKRLLSNDYTNSLKTNQTVPIYSTLSMDYHCPRCHALVRRSRKPVSVGGGIKLHGISCCCLSTVMPRGYDWPAPETWQKFIDIDEKSQTSHE